MLIIKYSLNSLNNLIVVPNGSRFLGLGKTSLVSGRDRAYVKVGLYQSSARWASPRRNYGPMSGMDPGPFSENFQIVRVVLLPESLSMEYQTILEYNETRSMLLSLGTFTLKSGSNDKQYDGYVITPLEEEDVPSVITAASRRTSGVINETSLTRQII